jgi:hypothetical protein
MLLSTAPLFGSKITVYAPSFMHRVFGAPNGTRLSARCHFTGPNKLSNSRAQPPPTCPRNEYARIQNIMHRAEYIYHRCIGGLCTRVHEGGFRAHTEGGGGAGA